MKPFPPARCGIITMELIFTGVPVNIKVTFIQMRERIRHQPIKRLLVGTCTGLGSFVLLDRLAFMGLRQALLYRHKNNPNRKDPVLMPLQEDEHDTPSWDLQDPFTAGFPVTSTQMLRGCAFMIRKPLTWRTMSSLPTAVDCTDPQRNGGSNKRIRMSHSQ